MKKGIAFVTLIAFFSVTNIAYASNTHTIDLELSSSQYLSKTDTASLSITGDISIEGWFKLEQLPSTSATVFSLVSKYDTDKRAYQLLILSDDTLRFTFFADEVPNYTRVVSTSAFVVADDVGSWVHFAVTADVSAGAAGVIIYKNASSVADTDVNNTATSIQDTTAAFQIGAGLTSGSPNTFFDGLIDDVRIWNDIRTGTEISDNYNCSLLGTEDGLVGYWKLDNSLLDETSNDNDLTNNNSAVFQSASLPFTNTCAVAGAVNKQNIIWFE